MSIKQQLKKTKDISSEYDTYLEDQRNLRLKLIFLSATAFSVLLPYMEVRLGTSETQSAFYEHN